MSPLTQSASSDTSTGSRRPKPPAGQLRPIAPRQRPGSASRPVLAQDLFGVALTRELKRADRFDESFALLLIALKTRRHLAAWQEGIDALTPSLLDTDIVGWLEQDAVIGVIRPLAQVEPTEAAAALGTAVQRALMRSLQAEQAGACSIRVDVYSPLSESPAETRSERTRREKVSQLARNASKRALDVAGSVALLGALSPIFLAVSGLIKLTSKGPVLFRQTRVGHDGRPFTMLKFRTMQANCDPKIHQQYVAQFIQAGASADTGAGRVFKIVDDPRVTRLGHFLRRTSLDELPQFWNVLRGDMSLVGPRPPLPYEVERYKRWHLRRLREAKPGITGLWQVTGRSRTTFDEMVRLDLRYAKNCSVWTDLKILWATPRAVVTGKGAH
jgi:lipopolysaccharide/colanic/teichoic acid biosynthesis glycosyltransferase